MGRKRAVIYARFSGDKQRETSIDDQVRNCTRFAEREGLGILETYSDRAISGSTRARPGYLALRDTASSDGFDVLLVDDLSRLSRDDYEMKGLLRAFAWDGLRVVGVSDGYDSSRKGHKIHAGFKGLMNELFLDDLRERTHRGMTGQAMKGYNCGGRTYGYRNVPIEDESRMHEHGRAAVVAVRYEIHQEQAEIVRKIHAWYADGYSYRWIASELNRSRVPSSRGSTWAVSAIKVILENEMYEGRLIWNRREWIKHPDTGKRVSKQRPREEWIVRDMPDLRVVPADIIARVRARQQRNRAGQLGQPGVSPAQRYLFSGLMQCAECGGSFVLVSHNKYGCSMYKNRGRAVCGNRFTVSRHIVEERLLRSIKERLDKPESLQVFKRAATELIESRHTSQHIESLEQRINAAKTVRDNLLDAIKQGIVTPSTKDALQCAEKEIEDLGHELSRAEHWKVSAILPDAVARYKAAVEQLQARLDEHVEPAREILRELVGDRIRIHRKGDHLEAELPRQAWAALVKSLNCHDDLAGCGGGIWNESYRICLAPTRADSTPLRHRRTGADRRSVA